MNFKNKKLLSFILIFTFIFSFNLFGKTYSSKSSSKKSSYKSSSSNKNTTNTYNSSKSTYSSKKSTPTTNIKVKSNTTTTNTNDKKNLSKTDSDLKAKIKAQEAKDALNTTRNINKVTVKDENNYKTKKSSTNTNTNYNNNYNTNNNNSILTHTAAAGAGYYFGKKSAEKKTVRNTTYSNSIYKAAYDNMRKYSSKFKLDEAREKFRKSSKAPENYYKELYPYYGIYDTIWLYEMMDNINLEKYRKFFFTHYTDSDIETWKQDLKKATQKYPELLSKLNKLELEYTMQKNSDKYKYSGNLFPKDEAEMILADYIIKDISDKYFYGKDKPINVKRNNSGKKSSPLAGLIFFAIIIGIIVIAIKSKKKN